jgi:hypothetical protein
LWALETAGAVLGYSQRLREEMTAVIASSAVWQSVDICIVLLNARRKFPKHVFDDVMTKKCLLSSVALSSTKQEITLQHGYEGILV